MDQIIHQLQSLNPLIIYVLVFATAFIENLFPPAPSDMLIVAAGSLVGMGVLGFAETLIVATAGSTVGFVVMYKIGDWFGIHILESGKIKFIPVDSVKKAEAWFSKYGYWLIVVNRFLAGTRAVVSFFAGMSELKITPTTILCFLSALVWNVCLVTAGFYLGQNWQNIGAYLKTYSTIVTLVVVIAAVIGVIVIFRRRGKRAGQA